MMRKVFYLAISLLFIARAMAQNIGVGTATPDSSAMLDISSDSTGILVPRLADTAKVKKPAEGLIIYSKNKKAPYYNDGTKWLSLGARGPAQAGVENSPITYQITGAGFDQTELPFLSASVGISNSVTVIPPTLGKPNTSDYSMMKIMDVNSKNFNLAVLKGTHITSIEFKYYLGASLIPYASHRFKDVYITSYQISGSAGGDSFTESISFTYGDYGFKDWVNGVEFGFDLATLVETPY